MRTGSNAARGIHSIECAFVSTVMWMVRSGVNEDHLSYFELAGRLAGLAVREGIALQVPPDPGLIMTAVKGIL